MSKMELGMLGSAFLWAYALLGPQAGYVGDRFPRRYVIICSLALWSTMTGLNGFATSGTQLIYLRVLLAVSEAFYMPCALALISEHHTEETQSKAIAIHLSSMAVGQVSGGFLGGFMGQYFSWRTTVFCPRRCDTRLTYRYSRRDFRLTDVEGNVVKDIIS
jgi:MFS family permease